MHVALECDCFSLLFSVNALSKFIQYLFLFNVLNYYMYCHIIVPVPKQRLLWLTVPHLEKQLGIHTLHKLVSTIS